MTLLPEIKILFYLFFVLLVSTVSNLHIYAVIFFALCVSIFFLKVPFRAVKSGWIPISIFLFFTFISNALNQHGKILFSSGPVIITDEGLNIAAIRTLRVLYLITGAKILIATSKAEEIINGLWRLLGPLERLGLPVKDYFHTMGLTLKCFPILKNLLYENYREQITSANIRGVWNRAKVVSAFLLPIFVQSIQNPEKFFIEPGPGEKTN
jgi:energy-coupling factor transport system permease protein